MASNIESPNLSRRGFVFAAGTAALAAAGAGLAGCAPAAIKEGEGNAPEKKAVPDVFTDGTYITHGTSMHGPIDVKTVIEGGAIASVATNVFLNWVLIYGRFGLPAMGIQGAALATVCAAGVNALVILLMGKVQKHPYLFRVSRHFVWSKAFVSEYFHKCFPILMNEILIGVGNMVINMVLGRQAEQAIAATAVFRTLEGLVIGFFAGFSNAASVLVGKCVGAGELDTAYERAKRLVYLCAGFIFVVCLTLVLAHKLILMSMSLRGESLEIGTGMLIIYCVAAVVRMSNWVQNDTYRSAGDAAFGTILEIAFMYLMVLPCVCLTGLVCKAPFLIVFACCYIDEPIRFVLMHVHLYSGKWIKPVTNIGKAVLPAFRAKHTKKNRKAAVQA